MSLLEGRTVIVTGAGRGLGRAHALMLAKHGANVIVNDLGSSAAGEGADQTPAQEVVSEIERIGGKAAINTADVSDWNAAKEMIDQAVDTFGSLDGLVNNAGIIRDRMLINMSEEDWDNVTKVHLKGTFAPLHHAANYWRAKSKAGEKFDATVVNTTSHSAMFANIGQTNYAAAKAGIATMTIVAARELGRYGVRLNAIAPRAQTRMTEGLRELTEEQERLRAPDWIATLVAYLSSTQSAPISGRVFEAWGWGYSVLESWQHGPRTDASMDPTEIDAEMKKIVRFARPNAGIDRDTWHDV
ncbi:putative short-chain dehydrogenase/reductase [Novosphingobium marinum]|uniref:NAD(P)-dependent dehydrogenase (Short-subunit alcohol dehydrogenase family) n=1 Tax=Novosphingobium marinum TaxID=1514948 RepID=A0A7Z0BRP8_9SPHN|nr:SDR family NAD(P)-dependent oxidoreductase [Novosphingobium marinum]NYH94041.1 NAD(P)-dependent dehydrogenase (short-subunit alcohol dehydrogenase family) [Novosphingobium marinum]GGC19148.1 putative short-chain dehydrogenase/reductase [Novosphingobium marinum]